MDWISRKSFALSGLARKRHLGKRHKHLAILVASMGILVAATQLGLAAQHPPATARRPARRLPVPTQAAARAEQPTFKAIFEPVNYNQDLKLLDAFFVTAEEGWVSGSASTILHTVDAGKTWTVQMGGDPQSQGVEIDHLFFLDRFHGWAQGYSHLYRTLDGQNWQEVGNDVRGNVFFTSPTRGFRGYGSIYQTLDGGDTWKEAFACTGQAQVQGLMQQLHCDVDAIHFPSSRIGYGVGSSSLLGGGVVVKTEDGGATWKIIYLPPEAGDQRTNFVFFIDENRGFAFRNSGLYRTVDGGKSWQGAAAPPSNAGLLKFADPEVGWAFVTDGGGHPSFTYTVDSGNRWYSRQVTAPAAIHSFSLPGRNTAYFVGDHGMIYRYRVVPVDYNVALMLDAPLMPGYNLQPIQADLQNVRQRIHALQAKLQAVQAQGGSQVASAASLGQTPTEASPTPATSTEATQNAAAAPADASAQTAAPGGFSQDASGGGFTQDTLVAGGFTQSTADSGAPSQTPGADAGFIQDTGPPSGFIQSCCAADVQNLQNSMGAFTQNIDAFTTKYRTLNLILAGMNLFSELVTKAQGLRTSFHTLRSARDAQSAIAALSQLSVSVNDMGTTAVSRFQGQAGLGGMQTQAPGSFQQQAPFPQ